MNPLERAINQAAADGFEMRIKAEATDTPQFWLYQVKTGGCTSGWYPSVDEAARDWLTVRRGYVVDRRSGERRRRSA